jgi:hypothetical protein
MSDGRLPSLIERVDDRLAPWGVTGCEALWPERANTPRARALRSYAALLYNVEDRELGPRCVVHVDGAEQQFAEVLQRIETLLATATDDSFQEADRVAHQVLGD